MSAETIQLATDTMGLAHELGRLDFVTALLAALTLLVALGGIFAFFDVRRVAKSTASAEAEKHAKEIAEAAAVKYLENELPRLISAYAELAQNAVRADQADAIAQAQEAPRAPPPAAVPAAAPATPIAPAAGDSDE
jgi:hypothetical protein